MLWTLSLVVLTGILALVAAPAVDWIGKAIQQKLHVIDGPLAALQQLRDALLPDSAKGNIGVDIVSVVQPVVSIVAPGIGQMMIFFGMLLFMVLGRNHLRRMLVAFFDKRDAKLARSRS